MDAVVPGRSVTLLEVTDLRVRYGEIEAVRGVSLNVEPGAFLLVLGPNGAGKTSLLSAISGVARASAGTVRLNGRDLTRISAARRVRLGVSMVPEGRGVLKGLSVRENLFLGWRASPRPRRAGFEEAVEEATRVFPRLRERFHQDCSTLSGGEMQMLSVLRAVLARPSVLLLDEPSLGLAPKAVEAVYEALGGLSQEGLPLIVVEQKNVPLALVPDRTLVMREGRVVAEVANGRPGEDDLADLYLGGQR